MNTSAIPQTGSKDPFFIWTGKILGFLQQNVRLLVAIVAVIVLGVTGLLIAQSRTESNWVKLNEAIFLASQSGEAAKALEKVIADWGEEKSLQARIDLVRLSLSKRDLAQALTHLDAAIKQAPSSLKPVLISSRIQMLWQDGKTDEALKAAQDFLATKPTGMASYYVELTQAEILTSQGKKDEAKAIYDRLAKEASSNEVISGLVSARLQNIGE